MIDESYRAAPFVPSASYTSGPLLPRLASEQQAREDLRRDLSLDLSERYPDIDYLTCWEMAGDAVFSHSVLAQPDRCRDLALLFSANYDYCNLSDITCWEMAGDVIKFIQARQ